MKLLTQVLTASKTLLSVPTYRRLLIPLAVAVFAFFAAAIPSIAIPNNTLALQLSLYTLQNYLTLGVLAVLATLLFLMNVYAYRRAKERDSVSGQVTEGASEMTGDHQGASVRTAKIVRSPPYTRLTSFGPRCLPLR